MITYFIQHQFIRFIFVGMLNTAVGYSFFALFIYAGFHYTTACLLSMCICVPFNFQTTGKFVFNNKKNSAFIGFAFTYAFSYFSGITFMKLFSYFSDNMYLVGAIAIVINAFVTFLLNKYIVFRETAYETN